MPFVSLIRTTKPPDIELTQDKDDLELVLIRRVPILCQYYAVLFTLIKEKEFL